MASLPRIYETNKGKGGSVTKYAVYPRVLVTYIQFPFRRINLQFNL